jgi:hypothetical protein
MVLRHALAQVRTRKPTQASRFAYSVHFIKSQLEGFKPLTLQQFNRIATQSAL